MSRPLPSFLVLLVAIALFPLAAMSKQGDPAKEGEMCGGIPGAICDKGLTCELQGGHCNVVDLAGKCVRTPEICTEEHDPVCDCKHITHGNYCKLLKADGQLDYKGECKKK